MESRARLETQKVKGLVEDIVKNGRVYQGGGNEVVGDTFSQLIKQSVEAGLERLFFKFSIADQVGWDRVVARAAQGAADALTALGYGGEVDKHPACQEIRSYVGGAGKRGSDIRRRFTAPPYGWPQDAIDGSLLALLAGGFLRASRIGEPAQARELNHPQIGVTDFFSEGVTISALQRIGVRNLAAGMGLPVQSGEELEAVPRILERLRDLAKSAGGDPPLPTCPDDSQIGQLQALTGNQQFVAVYDNKDDLLECHKTWSSAANAIQQRLPVWQLLEALLLHAQPLPVALEVKTQVEAIRANRGLLDTPDLVTPLVSQLTAALRTAVKDAQQELQDVRDREVGELEGSDEWAQLDLKDQQRIIANNGLQPVPLGDLSTDDALLSCLSATSIQEWENRTVALPARAANARAEATRRLEPEAKTVRPRRATLKDKDDVEAYIQQLRKELLAHIAAGSPVVIM